MEPLTIEEQEMAERYFYLVDEFLRRKHLNWDKHYDVVIFGYLQAIQRGCRNPNPPQNENAYGLIEVCMKRAVLMERRHQYQRKRRGDLETLSLDCVPAHTDDGEFSLYDVVADTKQRVEAQVEAQDLAERVLAVATPREREVIDLVCLGHETHEIAQLLGITRNTASKILYNFRAKAKAVWDDREVIRCPQWERNKEKMRARNQKYRQEHRTELNAKNRAYYAAHREEIRAKDRAKCAAKRAEKLALVQKKTAPDAANIKDGRPKGQI